MNKNNSLSSLILRYPVLNLAIICVITIIFGSLATHLKFDTSLSTFVIHNDPDMAYYNRLKEIFETDETVIIAFKARDLFSTKDLEVIKTLSDKISDLEWVRNVRSLTNANLITTTPEMFEVKVLVDTMPRTQAERETIKKHATTNYIYMKDLASVDGQYGSLLVEIKNVPDQKPTKMVIASIKNILREEAKRTNLKFYLAGDAIINYALGEYMQRDFFVFILPTYLILTFLLILTVGRLRDIAISLASITLSLIWSMGTIALLGKTLNNVTIGIIPLILCIALEDIYYLHNAYYDRLSIVKNKQQAFKEALAHIVRPCFFTSFTTVLGFGALTVNNVKPILEFSILGSIAVILAFVIAILFIPSIHILLRIPNNLEKKPRFKLNPRPLIAALGRFVEKRQKLFWFIIPFIFFVSIFGILKINIETDYLTFFYKNSEVYTATKFVENNLAGVSNLEITVSSAYEGGIKEPVVLREVEKLTHFLRRQEKIEKAISIVDFLKDMNRAMYDNDESYYRIPDTRELVAQYLLVYSMSSRRNDVEKDFVDYPYRLTRIRCRMSEHNSTAILALINKIKLYALKNIPHDLKVKITSYPVIYSNMVDSLARGQMKCLVLVFISLLIATSIYFRSLKIGLLAIVPNVIPIIFTLGTMGYLGITLNISTAMMAAIAIGLAMDDTTHFFSRFKQQFSQNPDYIKDTQKTLLHLGEPMMYSSFLMMAGYLILLLSQFRLTFFFGLLCALTIFIALLSDLLVTPWILMTFKPKFK